MNNLQESTIKAIFSDFDHDKQVNLICELMDIAKLDSIIQNNRLVNMSAAEINRRNNETADEQQQRLYRAKFDDWLYEFIPEFLVIVEKDYLDRCFRFFHLVVSKARGLCGGCPNDDGFGFCAHDDTDQVEDAYEDKRSTAMMVIGSESIEDNHLCSIIKSVNGGSFNRWRMCFRDLFVLIYNQSDDDVNRLLSFMGFIDDPVREIPDTTIHNQEILRLFPGLTLCIID